MNAKEAREFLSPEVRYHTSEAFLCRAEVHHTMRTQEPPFLGREIREDLNQGALELSWQPRSP